MKMDNKKTILITGATGFIGKQLVQTLDQKHSYFLRLLLRSPTILCNVQHQPIFVPDISEKTDWTGLLAGCEIIIHAAARVHVMEEYLEDPLHAFRQTNVQGTLCLAEQAAQQGVKRFIFISSIKVNGEETQLGHPYGPDDILSAPDEPYALSKYEAEKKLLALSAKTGMEVVIIRPPIVYGPGVKGNFQRMISWFQKDIFLPLPLKSIKNKRSFVSVYNLVDLLITCIDHPQAANQIFLVSDGEDVSTPELLQKIARTINKQARLVSVPCWILKSASKILKKEIIIQRLCSSLQVDINKTCDLLDWRPKVSLDEGLSNMLCTEEK